MKMPLAATLHDLCEPCGCAITATFLLRRPSSGELLPRLEGRMAEQGQP